jgi:hypothetical protein
MFVDRLRERFPAARIELVTEAWGGRNTGSYLAEPTGSEHNYQEKVLDRRPDLVVSEFVNDAGLSPEQVEERYGRLLADFRGINAEWIILTPHYVMPSWMKLESQRQIDEVGLHRLDPRVGALDVPDRRLVVVDGHHLRSGRSQDVGPVALTAACFDHCPLGVAIGRDPVVDDFVTTEPVVLTLDAGQGTFAGEGQDARLHTHLLPFHAWHSSARRAFMPEYPIR